MPPIEEGASEEETLVGQEQDDTDAEFSPFDEMRDEYKPSAIRKTTAADGLPTNTGSGTSSAIPPLSPETLICMGDFSEFFTAAKDPVPLDQVYRWGDGSYRRKLDDFHVFPKRPPCKHYVRQAVSDESLPNENKLHLRLCAARRTTEGTFMTVRDSAIWACSMREPRDIPSEEKYLDAFDALKVAQGRERTEHTIFNKEEK